MYVYFEFKEDSCKHEKFVGDECIVTKNKMSDVQMDDIFEMINVVLNNTEILDEKNYKIDPSIKKQTLENVALLCNKFPIIWF